MDANFSSTVLAVNHEVDFVAEKDGFTEYFQVAKEMSAPHTCEREVKALDAIDDHNKKTVLVADYMPTAANKGIIVRNAREWLLDV